ncbi:hypothetical protein EP227_00840 [bacterium]|nr:MAG: hypothetical protein EP227_00840 [bacterium]
MAGRKDFQETYNFQFGYIAIELGYITTDQLKEALAEQENDDIDNKPHRLLGTVLIEKGWMTTEQVTLVLEESLKRKASLSSEDPS